jgi:Uma2 family endonuclease
MSSAAKSIYCERGVKEYWIVDPEEKTIEIMTNDGRFFQTIALLRPHSSLESAMFPGLSMKVEAIFGM